MKKHISAQEIAMGLKKGRRSGNGWVACCPNHEDNDPSLNIGESKDGKPLIFCFAGCTSLDVIKRLREMGLWGLK